MDLAPLGDFDLYDTAWDAFDGDFLENLLQDGQGDVSSESPKGDALSSDADRSRSNGSTDRSQQRPGSSAKRGRTQDSAEEKLEKLRNRNRMAQARRRQRQKEELEVLDRSIAETKQKIQSAQIRSRTIREEKVATCQRLAQADDALRDAIHNTAQAPQPLGQGVQQPPPTAYPQAAIPTAGKPPPKFLTPLCCPPGNIVAFKHCYNGGEHILQSRKSRPIESYQAHCPLFIESCLANMSDSPMANPSFSNILHSHKTASLMGQNTVPCSEICWFLQSIHSTPDGIPMSINSSLSTVRCSVTLLHAYMLAQLECAMIDKELDCFNGLMSDEAASPNTRFSYGYTTGNMSPVNSGDDTGACSLIQYPLINIAQWSLGVTLSCGVNDSVDMCTAVTHTITNVLRSYRPHLPRSVWLRCCKEFLLKLDIMVGRKRTDGGAVPQQACNAAVRADQIPKNFKIGSAASLEMISSEHTATSADSGAMTGDIASPDDSSNIFFDSADPIEPKGDLQFAHKMEELRIQNQRAKDPGVACCNDVPKFEGIYMRVALLVQMMAQAVHNCMLETAVDNHRWQPSEARRRDVLERADLVDSCWRYVYCAVMNDAPYVARDCAVDICGPGLSSLEWMEETHAQLYKRLHLTADNLSRMVCLWRDWQRHRRALDTELEAACGHMSAIPNIEEISDSFVAFIASQCSSSGAGGASSYAAERACRFQPRKLLGLCPATTHAAHAALLSMQEIQDRDARLQVDFLATHIRPSMWSRAQSAKAVGSMVSHNVKFDHYMIWQIATLQARRYDLFVSRAFAKDVVPV